MKKTKKYSEKLIHLKNGLIQKWKNNKVEKEKEVKKIKKVEKEELKNMEKVEKEELKNMEKVEIEKVEETGNKINILTKIFFWITNHSTSYAFARIARF